MPLIIDPDDLNQGTEITLNTATQKFTLTTTGNLSGAGVSGQALYSFFKEEWKSDASLIPYLFPIVPITPEQFEFINGWTPADEATRKLIRSCGWREISLAGDLQREYTGVISLGNIDSADIPYFAFSSDTAKTAFDFSGAVNQAVQNFGDSSNGNFDKRSDTLTVYIRSQGKTYDSSTSTSIGLTSLNYIANRFPLAEAADSKVSASDTDIANNAPYTGMSIEYGAVTRDIGGVIRNFDIVVDGNNGTAEEIYEFVQYSLRQAGDIDDGVGSQVGLLANDLMSFAGDTLTTTQGVYIDNFSTNDTNRLQFTDTSDTARTFPFVAAGTLSFNSNLSNDADATYRMFFTSGYSTSSAILVDDNDGVDISGNISGNSTINWSFDYDNNVQGGRTAGTDASITVVAIGLGTAQYVSATATIGRATGQNISLVAPLERNYSND